MGSDVRFLTRAVGVLLIAGGITAWVGHGPLGWGTGAIALTGVAMVCALCMGYAGYKGACKAVFTAGTQVTPVLAGLIGGMAVALLVLLGTWYGAYSIYGTDWATRGVSVSVLLYVLLIIVKVVTVTQELRSRQVRPTDSSMSTLPSGNGASG